MSPHRLHRARLIGVLALSLLAVVGSGCAFFYENHGYGAGFQVYSDRSPQFVARVAGDVRFIRKAYLDLFGIAPRDIGEMTIVLDGQDDSFRVVDFGYSPDVLGYYLPGLAWISIDASPRWPRPHQTLDQIVLHEMAHHFIVTLDATASERCWLNEGLAGNLEMTLHEGAHFEYPFFHPVLYRAARRVAYARSEPLRVRDLIEQSWSEFHTDEAKAENYALSWALVWYALHRERPSTEPLGQRIRHVLAMERDELEALESGWNRFLRGFDLTRHLLAWAADTAPERRLTASWAFGELAQGCGPDDVRVLHGLANLLEHPHPAKRAAAGAAFVGRLESTPSFAVLEEPWLEGAVATVGRMVADPAQSNEVRCELVRATAASVVYRARWIPLLVDLLEDSQPDLRVEAARSLASFVDKPTITNPEFWRAASNEARAREVAEWRHWWAAYVAFGRRTD